MKFEALVLALVLLTSAAIAWQDRILRQTLVFSRHNASSFLSYGFDDQVLGGRSSVVPDAKQPLSWSCELREGYAYPFCGVELLFDPEHHRQGFDFSGFQTLTLTMSYQGSANTLRLHLKNHDPRYSIAGRSETSKFNKIDFPAPGKHQRLQFRLADVSVADWWLTANNIPPELSAPQLDNVISIALQIGDGSRPGKHNIQIHSIKLEGSRLSQAHWYLAILTAWLILTGMFLIHRISTLKKDLSARQALQAITLSQAKQAEEAARHDHLTQVYNRTGVAQHFDRTIKEAPDRVSVAVILVDVDCFKLLNDRYGHNYGDDVLASFAQILKRNVRSDDIVGRWGGEEFIIICKDVDEGSAMELADKVRSRIEHFHFGECERVTASFGVYCHSAEHVDLAELVRKADRALYEAKQSGRNRSVIYEPAAKQAA